MKIIDSYSPDQSAKIAERNLKYERNVPYGHLPHHKKV